MAIYVQPGATFEAGITGAPTGLVGTIGVRIIDTPDGSTVLGRTTTGIAENPPNSGYYTTTLTAPTQGGTYSVIWDTGSVSPTTVAAEELLVTQTAPIAIAPSGSDLTTLAAVRQFLQKPGSDTGQDPVITSLISRASKVIQTYAEREFAPATTATRTFRVNGTGRVHLRPYDLRTATAVTVDGSATTDFRLEPFPAKDGVYSWLLLSPTTLTTSTTTTWPEREVAITGDWGFASVPSEISHACIETVVEWLRGDVAAFSTAFNTESGRVEFARIIPDKPRLVIDMYRRPLVR